MTGNKDDISNNDLFELLKKLIKDTNKQTKNEIKDEIKEIHVQLVERIRNQDQQIEQLRKDYSDLEQKYTALERHCRKNNLVFHGLEVDETESDFLEHVTAKLRALLQIEIVPTDVNNIYVIGGKQGNPIKLEFVSYLKKAQILAHAKNLRNTGVFVSHDLNTQERKTRQILIHHLKVARNENHFAKIVGNRLKIDGKYFSVDQLPTAGIASAAKFESASVSGVDSASKTLAVSKQLLPSTLSQPKDSQSRIQTTSHESRSRTGSHSSTGSGVGGNNETRKKLTQKTK